MLNTEAIAKDAKKLLESGLKTGKKSFFKKNPDYFDAGRQCEQAAVKFRTIKAYSDAGAAYAQAGDFYAEAEQHNNAGKAYESGAQQYYADDKVDQSIALYQKAQYQYRLSGSHETAATLLTSAGRQIAEKDPAKSFELFDLAVQIFEDENSSMMADDTFQHYINALGKEKNWTKMLEVLELRIKISTKAKKNDARNKSILTMVIIHLSQNAVNEANDCLARNMEQPGFDQTQDWMLSAQLISAYQMENDESLQAVKKEQYFTFLPASVYGLLRSLTIVGGGGGATLQSFTNQQPKKQEDERPMPSSQPAGDDNDDEDEDEDIL
ncbi:putative soluble nsf attachment protein gamma [Blattamonas nauphoetae]|uniref:Gamma-soluble NSF attachment protein n=1 Tax=Blattamonas nauphoetae TaxID=2049346 RepID=A0ABQ9YLR6_9EUKA|nr:putative soluble nsf attachment protein gamma [Blattamonas nauphoetae]